MSFFKFLKGKPFSAKFADRFLKVRNRNPVLAEDFKAITFDGINGRVTVALDVSIDVDSSYCDSQLRALADQLLHLLPAPSPPPKLVAVTHGPWGTYRTYEPTEQNRKDYE